MGRRSQRVKGQFSETDTSEAVDFEISFAALLATLSLTYPHSTYPTVSQGAAFAVLTITLLRRMAILSRFADNEEETRRTRLMAWSIPIIEFASVTSILILFIRVSESLPLQGASTALYWVGVTILVLFIALVQEVLFRDELLWWYQKFIDRFEKSDDSTFWLFLSARAWSWSQAPIADNASGRFHYGPPTDEDEYSLWDALENLVKGSGLFLLGSGVLFFLGYLLLDWVGIAFVLAATIVRDQVRFWFVAYGNGTFEQLAGPWYRTYLAIVIYLGMLHSLL